MGHFVVVPSNRLPKSYQPGGGRKSSLQEMVEEFLEGEGKVAEYVTAPGEYANKFSKYYTLMRACNRYGVKVRMRGDHIYMVRENASES